jgi:hypothetical protein
MTFPEEDVERVLKMEAYTLSDVIQPVGLLEQTVQKLTETSIKLANDFEVARNDLGWIETLPLAILDRLGCRRRASASQECHAPALTLRQPG